MKLEAKTRLTAMRPLSLPDWKRSVLKDYPKAKFTTENGSGNTYGEEGDITAHVGKDMQADVVGVYSYSGEVCWVLDKRGEFVENEIVAELTPNSDDAIGNGEAFEQIVSQDPDDSVPMIQRLMTHDGGFEPATEQPLLNDDLAVK